MLATRTPLAAVLSGEEMAGQAAELWTGCSFGCQYCLPVARRWAKLFPVPEGEGIAERRVVARVGDVLNIEGLSGLHYPPPAFLSLMSDPYPLKEETAHVTRRAIAALHEHGVGARILTKSGTRAVRDFDLLGSHPDDAFGATLSLLDDDDSRRWEPGAALPAERLAGLEEAHRRGIPTWASLTPVIEPAQALELIRLAAPFVDLFSLGALECDDSEKRAAASTTAAFDWPDFARRAIDLCRQLETPAYVRITNPPDARSLTAFFNDFMELGGAAFWPMCCAARKPSWTWTPAAERAAVLDATAEARFGV